MSEKIEWKFNEKRKEPYFECPFCGCYIWKDEYESKLQDEELWQGMYCGNPNCGWPKQIHADEDEDEFGYLDGDDE